MNYSRNALLTLLALSVALNLYLLRQQSSPVSVTSTPLQQTDVAITPTPILEKPDSSPSSRPPVIPGNRKTDHKANAQRLFTLQEYDEAVAAFDELLYVDQHQAKILHLQWQANVRLWLEQQTGGRIDLFIPAFLAQFPYDTAFLTLQAQRLIQQGEILAALDIYYSLSSYSQTIKQQDSYLALLHTLANSHLERLKQQLAWQAIIDFSQHLLNYDADYAPFRLAVAQARLYLKNFDEAQFWLTGLLDDPFYQGQAKKIAEQITRAKLQQSAIPLQRRGSHYLIAANINQTTPVQLMLDTGASLSVISKQVFDTINQEVQAQLIKHVNVNTAGGQVYAPVYQAAHFAIDDFYLTDFQFLVMEMGDMQFSDGLLGMNFLQEFEFQLDQDRALLILSYK